MRTVRLWRALLFIVCPDPGPINPLRCPGVSYIISMGVFRGLPCKIAYCPAKNETPNMTTDLKEGHCVHPSSLKRGSSAQLSA